MSLIYGMTLLSMLLEIMFVSCNNCILMCTHRLNTEFENVQQIKAIKAEREKIKGFVTLQLYVCV